MQCREFEARLQGDLDLRRESAGDVDLDAHAALCAECSSKREFFVQLARLTNSLSASDVRSPGQSAYDRDRLIRSTVARSRSNVVTLAERPAPPRRVSYALSSSIAAVAACLAVCVGLFALGRPDADSNGPSVAADAPAAPVVASADRAATATPDAPGSNVPGEGDPTLAFARWSGSSLAELSDDPAMTRPLRPIASSFGVAWDTVRRALPTASSDADPTEDQAYAPTLDIVVTV